MLRKLVCLLICLFPLVSFALGNTVYHDTHGHSVEFTKLKGKWIIVNYWAPWCDTCMGEVPALNSFYRNNQNKNILIYGVNFDRMPMDDLKQTVSKARIAFPVLEEDPNQIWQFGDIDVVPMTFIINPKGSCERLLVLPQNNLYRRLQRYSTLKMNTGAESSSLLFYV